MKKKKRPEAAQAAPPAADVDLFSFDDPTPAAPAPIQWMETIRAFNGRSEYVGTSGTTLRTCAAPARQQQSAPAIPLLHLPQPRCNRTAVQ
jgi:hypothetical protein